MADFPGLPEDDAYDFGTEFNYAVWPIDTTIDLVNVPWNNDYRDIVKFPTRAALDSYIDSLAPFGKKITDMSYIKPNASVRLDLPMNTVLGYNYLRAVNPVQPIPGDTAKSFYYFITDVRYVNPSVTEVSLQLDVWQTYGYDVTFGNSYVERGHIGIANTKQFENYGRDYLTIPEGMDIGGEYQIVTKKSKSVLSQSKFDDPDPDPSKQWAPYVIAVSTVDLKAAPGTVTAPILKTAPGSTPQGMASGASFYVWENYAKYSAWLINMQGFPWVTQGIINVFMFPNLSRYGQNYDWEDDPASPDYYAPKLLSGNPLRVSRYQMMANWRASTEISDYIPERYRHLRKLYTFPYMAIEMTTFSGNPAIVKPEVWNDAHCTVIERPTIVPPNQRITFHPFKYNARSGMPTELPGGSHGTGSPPQNYYGGDDYGDWIDVGVGMQNFPTMPVVNNGAIGYLASNANTLQFQNQAADWSQQKALAANQASYDNASTAINQGNALAGIEQYATWQQNNINQDAAFYNALLGAAGSGVNGGIGGAATAGGPGAVLGAATGGLGGIMGALSYGVSSNAAQSSTNLSIDMNKARAAENAYAASNIRDTNKTLGDWAARGDYSTAIAAINAKVRDAALTQPSVSGQFGGDASNMAHQSAIFSLRFKMIDQAAIRTVGEFWLRYGYAIHKYMTIPESLMVMTKFTFWKLTETYISSAPMPETFKQTIRGIFEKGVTVWANPTEIGQIDIADNDPIEGISY